VNELNGREFGDRVLRNVADGIDEFLRYTKGIASRFEADRFDVFCLNRHPDEYKQLLDRLQDRLDRMPGHARITIRMGVKPYREDVSTVVLFDRARVACNKLRGSNNHLLIFDDEMHEREMFEQRLINDLNWAVEENQFIVYFQPKYDIQSDPPRLSSAEALVRWQHPVLGMIPPGDFIPLFENNGLIQKVDNYVWETAARQIADWRDRLGFMLPISVNLSRIDMVDEDLEDKLKYLIAVNRLSPKDFKLEVTESAYTDESLDMVAVIKRLRGLGFEVEMDDFGSGYSSLNTLSSLPIDVLKMDMKFIRSVDEDIRNFRMIELILDIANFLVVPVVAEGVETEEQLQMLREAKCDLVQGFYFSRPLPAEEFEKLILKEQSIKREV
jgi:EAL domain-containing protein (putative c-di-GMP-specific phosphodiesterase class I)